MSKDLHFKMREEEVAHLLTEVENGEAYALDVYANLKQHKKLYEDAVKQIEPLAIQEAENWTENSFKHNGFSFEKRSGGTRYSFSHIPAIKTLEDKIKELKERAKKAYLAKQKGLLIADENGEEIILPKISYSKSSLIVK